MFAAGREQSAAGGASVRAVSAVRDFDDDEALLSDVLAQVVRADPHEGALALHERTVALAGRARDGDEASARELAELVAGLDPEAAEVLVRSLTRWFQLVNLAEDNERVRRIRAPRRARRRRRGRGSLRERCATWPGAGVDAARDAASCSPARSCAW